MNDILCHLDAQRDTIQYMDLSGQAVSIGQVSEGINQISNVVQTNSATSQETAASSQELLSHAKAMNDLVKKFTLR